MSIIYSYNHMYDTDMYSMRDIRYESTFAPFPLTEKHINFIKDKYNKLL